MELRLAGRTFGPGEYAVMAGTVAEGVDIALVAADPPTVRALHSVPDRPAIAVAPESADQAAACVRAGADLIVGDAFAGVAAATGAALACSSPDRARGVRPDGVLVTAATVAEAGRLAGAGLAVLVEESQEALMAVYAWLGARVLHATDERAARQVLEMVAAIRGARTPAVARRGLA